MRSKFLTDLQDPSDGFPSTVWDEFYTNFFPSSLSNSRGNPTRQSSCTGGDFGNSGPYQRSRPVLWAHKAVPPPSPS